MVRKKRPTFQKLRLTSRNKLSKMQHCLTQVEMKREPRMQAMAMDKERVVTQMMNLVKKTTLSSPEKMLKSSCSSYIAK